MTVICGLGLCSLEGHALTPRAFPGQQPLLPLWAFTSGLSCAGLVAWTTSAALPRGSQAHSHMSRSG